MFLKNSHPRNGSMNFAAKKKKKLISKFKTNPSHNPTKAVYKKCYWVLNTISSSLFFVASQLINHRLFFCSLASILVKVAHTYIV